mmetsp:Transcript_9220/g.25923  ORF Transcript_9220/g.25923 Transcript_9220/m.25923 type:complete len:234 (+) Transcript_9220:2677-3378(+)
MAVAALFYSSIGKPGGRLTLGQRHELSYGTSLTKRDKRWASRTREYKNKTVLCLRVEASFAVRKIIVPYSHEDVVEPELSDERLVAIESATPLGKCLSVVKSNIVNMFQSQSRVLVGSIHESMERRTTRTREDDGVDKVRGPAICLVSRLRRRNCFHYENARHGKHLLHRPVKLAEMFMADCLNHLAGQNTIKFSTVLRTTGKGSVIAHFKGNEVIKTLLFDPFGREGKLLDG